MHELPVEPTGKLAPRKSLGQHFLRDQRAADRIVQALQAQRDEQVVEIGPGEGALTGRLLQLYGQKLRCLEVDARAVDLLRRAFPAHSACFVETDCLHFDFSTLPAPNLLLVGNLPYNISSQILFLVLELHARVRRCVFMLQLEVAQRIAAQPGSRQYGILSVLLQAHYHASILLTLPPGAFTPPPKVNSAVLVLERGQNRIESVDEVTFSHVVKAAFNQRRKTLRNALRNAYPGLPDALWNTLPYAGLRPEQLSVERFVEVTKHLSQTA